MEEKGSATLAKRLRSLDPLFLLFSSLFILDGIVTVIVLQDSRASELNPLLNVLPYPLLIVLFKALAIVAIRAWLEPPVRMKWPKFPRLFYAVGAVSYWTVCVWNFAILTVSKVAP